MERWGNLNHIERWGHYNNNEIWAFSFYNNNKNHVKKMTKYIGNLKKKKKKLDASCITAVALK